MPMFMMLLDNGSCSIHFSTFLSDSDGCQTGFFQCGSKKHHCIGQRYLCDGYNDCPDGSDETTLQCGEDDWCDGKLR